MKRTSLIALGTALAVSLAGVGIVNAASTDMTADQTQATQKAGSTGNCGTTTTDGKKTDGKCSAGSCGASQK